MSHPLATTLGRVQRLGLLAGGAGVVGAALVLLLAGAEPFFQGYLAAYVFWIGLSLGCLTLLMLHHLVAGDWGFVTQRLLEPGALTVILMAALFVPLLFGLDALYEWTDPAYMRSDEVLKKKAAYLNVPFFMIRAAVYFAFWIGMAVLLSRWARRLDETGSEQRALRLKQLGTAGLIGHILLATLASVDWMMSLDPHWFSTIFGWLWIVSNVLSALAFVSIALGRAWIAEPLRSVVHTKHFHDYGNLLLAFVILWTYMSFAQYLVIWAGNLPEDIRWYVQRDHGFWFWVTPFLVVFHFAVPFFVLLMRRAKRSVRALSLLAAWVLVAHAVYVGWTIIPSYHHAAHIATYAAAGAALVGIGGLWMAAYAWFLARRPLLPKGDPRFDVEALRAHAEG